MLYFHFRFACWRRLGSTLARIVSSIVYHCIISSKSCFFWNWNCREVDLVVRRDFFLIVLDFRRFTCSWDVQCIARTPLCGGLGNSSHQLLWNCTLWVQSTLSRCNSLVMIFIWSVVFDYGALIDWKLPWFLFWKWRHVKVEFLPKFSVSGIWKSWRESYPSEGDKAAHPVTVFTGVCLPVNWC